MMGGQISASSNGSSEAENSVSCQRWSTSTIPLPTNSGKLLSGIAGNVAAAAERKLNRGMYAAPLPEPFRSRRSAEEQNRLPARDRSGPERRQVLQRGGTLDLARKRPT